MQFLRPKTVLQYFVCIESHKGLQNALYKLQKYCFDWQLTVNINKTKILTFQKTFSPTERLIKYIMYIINEIFK
jgi:hypothetical protein